MASGDVYASINDAIPGQIDFEFSLSSFKYHYRKIIKGRQRRQKERYDNIRTTKRKEDDTYRVTRKSRNVYMVYFLNNKSTKKVQSQECCLNLIFRVINNLILC